MSRSKTVTSIHEPTAKVGSVRGVGIGKTQYLERRL